MFEYIYTKDKLSNYKVGIKNSIDVNKSYVPIVWTEHCIECSAPHCYQTCSRYQRRVDGACVRIKNGISPFIIDGVLGAKVEFRTWAKIEGKLRLQSVPGNKYKNLCQNVIGWGNFLKILADVRIIDKISNFITYGWYSLRQKYINHYVSSYSKADSLSLIGDVINNDVPTSLHVDIKNDKGEIKFRESVDIPLGKTSFHVNIPPYEDGNDSYYINLHPGNAEQHVTLLFKQLELQQRQIIEGKKVKCVIWDLDNTLWDGVLIEDKNVKPRHEFIELIKSLDSCGIVNSIASKNNIEDVDAKLNELGIADYFVFKKVNWNPKSVNVSQTIKQMNINPNTIVFVDDNPFERNEVLLVQPDVTCVDPVDILSFSKCDRFNVVVTDDSRNRRGTYKMLESMKTEEEEWNGSIDDFLMSCNMNLIISKPQKNNIVRCYELLQRTNQLNSSGRRLSLEEVESIVENPQFDSYVLQSSDKFGDYGIVGFMIVDKSHENVCITDFVISCRVANRKIENSLINYLSKKYGGDLLFNYKNTSLNGPMKKVIDDMNMKLVSGVSMYNQYLHSYIDIPHEVVKINDETI